LTPPIERPAGACLSEPCPAGTFPQQHLAIDQPGGPSITVLAIQSIVISLTALAQGSSGTDAAAPGILEQLSAQCSFIWSAIQNTPWAFWREYAWRDYWMHSIFDDRFLVIYYLPWVLILLLLKGKALRIGIIVTSLAFLAYLHGPLYPIYWLVLLLGVYAFTQRWQIESQRTDVWRGGPIVAAIVLVIGIVALTGLMESLRLNSESNTQLHERFWWLWPLAYRGAWWEPHPGAEPSQLFQHVWFNPHIIGIAYLTVRLLHYFSELRKNTIPAEERTLPRFLAYFSYAPSLIQGPIERYDKFNSEIDNCHTQRSLGMAAYGLYRIALGLSKSLISTWYFHPLVGWILSGGGIGDGAFYKTPHLIESYWLLYLGALGQIFMLYIEFSGYCDIAIGMSHIIGYRHIINFKLPWISTSYRDFWRRWHISLSFLLRDYLYIQLGGNRRHVWLNLAITFGLCGIWHAPIPILLIWGVLMGTMVYINHVWAKKVAQADEAQSGWLYKLRQYGHKLRPLPTILAWYITINSFFLSLLIFFGSIDGVKVMWELVRRPVNGVLGVELPALAW
jgi:D-alanyl-lipoteichoic acid acyltransferase DltB (MBOAT superfamily)